MIYYRNNHPFHFGFNKNQIITKSNHVHDSKFKVLYQENKSISMDKLSTFKTESNKIKI